MGQGGAISKRGVSKTKSQIPVQSQTSSSTFVHKRARPVHKCQILHTCSNAKTHNIKVVAFFKTNSTI